VEAHMLDVVLVVGTISFLVLSVGYATVCDWL
jgi:hypothetical protein